MMAVNFKNLGEIFVETPSKMFLTVRTLLYCKITFLFT